MNPIEITGFICGIAGIYLTMKESIWCFPIGLINVIMSLILFYSQLLYADAMQQVVYIILLTYGWYKWLHGDKNSPQLKVSSSSRRLLFKCLIIWVTATALLGYVLASYTNAATPWPDSGATILSFIAQWMVAKKKLENWLIWMVVNTIYVIIYLYKGLDLYALLFTIYFFMAIFGYNGWKSEINSAANA